IQNGSFTNYTYKKRQMLLKRLDRLKRQLDQLNVNLKTAATGTIAAGMMMLNTSDAHAQLEKVGTEFKVNTENDNGSYSRRYSDIAMDEDGDFVIAWSTVNTGVYAQRFNAEGVAQGDEFTVASGSVGYNLAPAVAMDSDGDFVITWQMSNLSAMDDRGIQAQRYNSSGEKQGSVFLVNTHTTGNQNTPDIAMDADGDFVIVWSGDGGYVHGGTDIMAQRFDASGNKVESEFRVNFGTFKNSINPAISMDADGDFVVTWQDENVDGDDYGIEARLYNASGEAQTDPFLVNTLVDNYQTDPATAMDADGNFVITWNSDHSAGFHDVYARRYNVSAVAQDTEEFLVNTFKGSGSIQDRVPSIAMSVNGDFVITWDGFGQGDDFSSDIYAQRYNASGIAQGDELVINTERSNDQKSPTIAIDSNGDFVIAWSSEVTSYEVINAQRFELPKVAPILDVIEDKEVDEGELLAFTISASDENNDELTYSLDAESIALGMTLNSTTGEFNWTPDSDQSGTYDVTVTVSDGDLTDSEAFKITVADKLISSVEGELSSDITLFPNPATSEITLNSESSVFDSYEISDLSGGLVQAGNLLAQKSISIADLPTGIYMLKVSGVDGVKTIRFIKK
ncbi:putative Ig domain-containing protein, partial [Reichenbachiella versicolor]|uniref:putative Ig domain-containing protein n=1 Tax=Reichenbachiella versicolor TaxID=1821036 RepID=UPI001C883D12